MQEKKQINVEIGARIKEEREKAGLTQERFSELIGLGTKSVSAFELGTVGISFTTLKKTYGEIAQLARATGSYPVGRWFESISRYQ